MLVLTITYPHVSFKTDWTTGKTNPVDLWMTASTIKKYQTYVGDVKSYLDPEHPRDLFQYPDYMVDYEKLRQIKKRALNDKQNHRTPILIAVFPTYIAIWDLNKVSWEGTAEWRLVNQKGVDYGKKEWELMAFLPTAGDDVLIIPYKVDKLKN